MDAATSDLENLFALYDEKGAQPYDSDLESVTQREHALQTAYLAEASGAVPALIAAALFHDIGHILDEEARTHLSEGRDDHHETIGASHLEKLFGPAVAAPVRLHVAAKRYLCAIDEDYYSHLSDGSRYTLGLQGGPMNEFEVTRFEDQPFYAEAVKLRQWDDLAKEPGRVVPGFAHYAERLDILLRTRDEDPYV